MMLYAPLTIDVAFEERYRTSISSWSAFLRKITVNVHVRLYYQKPFGRVSLEKQLRDRPDFPTENWEAQGMPTAAVRRALQVVAKELHLPNDHLIPSDPMRLVLISDYDDFPLAWLRHKLRHRLQAEFQVDELVRIATDCEVTVEAFVRDVLSRSRVLSEMRCRA
jgi:hypothetical protein